MNFGLVVFISGTGSNLSAIIQAIENQFLPAQIKAVICNEPDAYGLEIANKANIPTFIIPHKHKQREPFEREILNVIVPLEPDLIVLAGFLRILSPFFYKSL